MENERIEVANYMIKSTDSIQTIANLFQTTPKVLIQLNGNQPLIIKANRLIKVPLLPHLNQHVVKSDETIQDLLIRFKLTPEELLMLNEDLQLAPGQVIKLKP